MEEKKAVSEELEQETEDAIHAADVEDSSIEHLCFLFFRTLPEVFKLCHISHQAIL